MSEIHTYPAMNETIKDLLRRSEEPMQQYTLARIEELEQQLAAAKATPQRAAVHGEIELTLHGVLGGFFGYTGEEPDGPGWNEAYRKLVDVIYYAGAITGEQQAADRMISTLDQIDSQDGEI